MTTTWTVESIQALVQQRFNKQPCHFQLQVARALYSKQDVIACAPTGAGKTLSFWIPLLMSQADGEDKMTIVVTPLNLLGKQTQDDLKQAGLHAIAISQENSHTTLKAVTTGKYDVVIINPEILMTNKLVLQWWQTPAVTNRILNFIFDEAHCVSQWASFRRDYLQAGALCTWFQLLLGFHSMPNMVGSGRMVLIASIVKMPVDSFAICNINCDHY